MSEELNIASLSAKPTRPMIKMVIVAAAIIIIIGIIFYRSFAALPFALGVIITSALNVMKIRMLEKTVLKVVNMNDQEAGKNTVRFQYLLRYLMTGIVLVAIGLIQNYTTAPPFYSSREFYLPIWVLLFPNAPQSLTTSPLISIWGALAGIFTMQLSVLLVRFMKFEADGTEFIEYKDDENGEAIDKDTDKIADALSDDYNYLSTKNVNNSNNINVSDTSPDSSGRG
ncbi:MAG: hypothetical protein FWD05_09470 [Oscillospiraceae bacterium]|nr:hypothetical protein [Oscillospiraceae bacterium]